LNNYNQLSNGRGKISIVRVSIDLCAWLVEKSIQKIDHAQKRNKRRGAPVNKEFIHPEAEIRRVKA
jgi:hypothetical protein